MSSQDAELAEMRAEISCAVLLEQHPPPWQLDKKESTRHCLKYRRAKGEILLVTHQGRGWWDPGSRAKGDVFGLMQYLSPGLNFGAVRKALRPFIGLSPAFPAHERPSIKRAPDVPFTVKWELRRLPSPGSPTWRYLTETRGLPGPVVTEAISAGVLREGPYASAWFAHLGHDGCLTGIEMRGPDYRGFSPGGEKTLFRFSGHVPAGNGVVRRLVVAEAPIDAMSVAAIEQMPLGSLYVATAGALGPGTIGALARQFWALAKDGGELVIATDDDRAGHAYADQLAGMARAFALKVSRLPPTGGAKDWNDVLQPGRDA
jgi:hypothetical protein